MRDWMAIVAVGLGTYLLRASMIVAHRTSSAAEERTPRALGHLTPAVLAALVAPAFLVTDGAVQVQGPVLLAAVAGGLVAWRTRGIPQVLVTGLAVHQLATWAW
jgi:branched-subunit amino acid transport protein